MYSNAFVIYELTRHGGSTTFEIKACFKRRATAVLSWLDCSSIAARHYHDLVSDVEFNSLE